MAVPLENVEELKRHAEKLKMWLLSEEGFGKNIDLFFRENSQYFDDYQDEHALHYTTLHKDFVAKFEAEIHGWLADEGLTEEHLEAMLLLSKAEESQQELADDWVCLDSSTEVAIDTMLNVLDYQKWIHNIFELKKKIRQRHKVRVRRAPAAPPPPPAAPAETATQSIEVMVPEGMTAGQVLPVTYMGQQYEFVIPEGVEPGNSFQAAIILPA
eukprot:TRINITY_DN36687_c0_g2_i1.p1 TRINITY_DN36687_c0_g2~~TRINITY_DN36687_c0_g2_i1.p1  ORF type:complete len:213 (-),score=61.52 TRINITY_DN36687_c0_g2_i1:63-701(-)